MILLEDINTEQVSVANTIAQKNPGDKIAPFTNAEYLTDENPFIKETVCAVRIEVMCNPEKW